jgi:hypothetical protein
MLFAENYHQGGRLEYTNGAYPDRKEQQANRTSGLKCQGQFGTQMVSYLQAVIEVKGQATEASPDLMIALPSLSCLPRAGD